MQLIVLFVDICLFKRGPQDVPASGLLFALALAAYWVVGILVLSLQHGWLMAVVQVVAGSGLLLGFCWVLLFVANRLPRLLQTATTLLGTDALISLPGGVLMSWGVSRPDLPGVELGLLALALWYLAVVAQVLRLAASTSMILGVALAVSYFGLSYLLTWALLGAPPA